MYPADSFSIRHRRPMFVNPYPNPNPSLAMIPQPQTLTLTLILSLLFSSASSHSQSPSPSPSESIMSDPIGALGHPPPLPEIFPHRPLPSSCPSDRIDCLESHHGNRRARVDGGPPTVKENGKLNFGQKIGIVFAAAAILLQVVLGGFLVYKRVQLKKVDQRGTRLVSSSS